jgi:uncharacterized membrane protein YccC
LVQPPRFDALRRLPAVREALRFAPARPNFAAGLRAGLATTVPLLLVALTGRHELIWTSLAGFNTVLVDKGGAYRTRAASMLSLALGGALAVWLGSSVAAHPALAIVLALVVVWMGSIVRVFGAEATAVGVCTSVTLVVALARPADSALGALESAGFCMAGSVWAALISLVLWPLRPYRPAAQAVGESLRELAAVADSFVGASMAASAQVRRREQLGRTREAIERARAALGRSRRGRPGPSRRGEQLVALLEAADQLFAVLVALEDGLALAPPETLPALPQWIDAAAKRIASELRRLAQAIEHEAPAPPAAAPRPSFARLARVLAPHVAAPDEYVPRVLARALESLDRLVAVAAGAAAQSPISGRTDPSELSTDASRLSLLRDHLTLDSAMFRHALRMSISTAVAISVMHALALEHGYWATLTCLVILQPHGSATWAKALQRVLGTVLGAGVAMLVASYVHEPHVLVLCVFSFVSLGMALLPINYGAFAVFLTPGFVLLAETQAGNFDLAGVRVVNTLLGAGIALLGSRLLFPLSERDALGPLLTEAFDALHALLFVAASPKPSPSRLHGVRRRLGLALLNAEASYQRLLTESGIAPAESEAVLTLLLFAHRLASGLIALAMADGTHAHRALVEHADELASELAGLREANAQRRAPAAVALPASVPASEEHAERVEVLFAQLSVLRSALSRWNAGRPLGA